MNPVGKALWFIESHFSAELTLEEIAAARHSHERFANSSG
jgi:hypothetical protein